MVEKLLLLLMSFARDTVLIGTTKEKRKSKGEGRNCMCKMGCCSDGIMNMYKCSIIYQLISRNTVIIDSYFGNLYICLLSKYLVLLLEKRKHRGWVFLSRGVENLGLISKNHECLLNFYKENRRRRRNICDKMSKEVDVSKDSIYSPNILSVKSFQARNETDGLNKAQFGRWRTGCLRERTMS